MNILRTIKKYFIYDDKLRTIVGVITGMLIAVFNTISGFLIVHILGELFFGIKNPGQSVLLLYIFLGMAAGAAILKLCILFIELILRGTGVEEYSYLRLVLLFSVAAYMFALVFYALFSVSTMIHL